MISLKRITFFAALLLAFACLSTPAMAQAGHGGHEPVIIIIGTCGPNGDEPCPPPPPNSGQCPVPPPPFDCTPETGGCNQPPPEEGCTVNYIHVDKNGLELRRERVTAPRRRG